MHKKYEYWLAAIPGLANGSKQMLREHMKSAERAYYIEETALQKLDFLTEKDREILRQAKKKYNPEEICEELETKQIQVAIYFEETYPSRLKMIADNPYAIYFKGNLPDEKQYSVGMVGARRCTAYGETYAYEYAKILSEFHIQIISGLARGIDGVSQRGALVGGGKTFAVMGNGVDICYPRENSGLYGDILAAGGGILSELPPGTPPMPYQFPRRNRIISGLSDTVLVMEAREKSGSLITADMALEQGKDVYALPGSVDNALSLGCNRLIWQGAGILLSPGHLLEELGVVNHEDYMKFSGKSDEKCVEKKKVLETKENLVYSSVGFHPKSANQIVSETGLSAQVVFQLLSALEIQGMIKEVSKNYYVKA